MTDKKYPVGGYAPGNYYCKCGTCGEQFQGDKRAFQCEPCGEKAEAWYKNLTEDERNKHHQKFKEAIEEARKKLNHKI